MADALEAAGLASRKDAPAPRLHGLIVTGGRAGQTWAAARLGVAFDRPEHDDAPAGPPTGPLADRTRSEAACRE